jgi:hypothetical protein
MRRLLVVGAIALTACLSGCTHSKYVTPGGPADMVALGISHADADRLTDMEIAARMSRRPAASFPAAIAVLRVQGRGYCNYTTTGYGEGDYTIVTSRDVEDFADWDVINRLPMVRGIATVNRLTSPPSVKSEMGLRSAAAELHADILFVYTFDTVFHTETTVPALGVITLGLFPNERARVTSTVSGAFIDVRTGYIYGTAEATNKNSRITNAWNTESAVDKTRVECERSAFKELMPQVEQVWNGIVKEYATGAAR